MRVRPEQTETIYDRKRIGGPRPVDTDLGAEAALFGFTFDGDAPPEPPHYLVKNLLPAEGVQLDGGAFAAHKFPEGKLLKFAPIATA